MRFSFLLPLCASFASAVIAQAITVEAETGVKVGVTTLTELEGFTGEGYVGGWDEGSDTLTLAVEAPSQGLYDLSVRYAGIYGSKYTRFVLNDQSGGEIYFPESTSWEDANGGKVLLNAGVNTIKFENNWGWYLLDSVTLSPSAPRAPHQVTPALINTNSNAITKKLMKFLVDNYGKKYISGQQEPASFRWVEQNVGKTPAILGVDFIEYSPSRVEFGSTSTHVEDAIAHHKKGGIVTFCWHWNSPSGLINVEGSEWWRGFYTEHTRFDISAALANETNSDYKLLIRDIDAIAVQIKRLEDAGVPILFRPLHEAEGGWFWWGAKGPEPCKKLWRIMYERLTHHHKLNNLIWIWNSVKSEWYPGDDVVDIASVDSYPAAGDHGPVSGYYEQLVELTGDKKLIAMTECGSIPDPDLIQIYGSHWSWFVVWGGEFIEAGQHNSLDYLKKIYNMDYVLTLDEIQGWADDDEEPEPTPTSTSTQIQTPTPPPTTTPHPSSVSPAPTTSPTPTPTACGNGLWQQCGGIGYTGCKSCVAGATCRAYNDWYHQCIPA